MNVPNQPASAPHPALRLSLVGECPGADETHQRRCPQGHLYSQRPRCPACGAGESEPAPQPFVGPAGRLLWELLGKSSLRREQAFVGNIAQVTLTAAELADPSHLALQQGMRQLAADLQAFRPNVVVLLGGAALRAFHPLRWTRSTKGGGGEKFAARISDWRGSWFEGRLAGFEGKSAYGVGTGQKADGPAALQKGESTNPADLQTAESKSAAPLDGGNVAGAVYICAQQSGNSLSGTLLTQASAAPSFKCLASFHPAAILHGGGPWGDPQKRFFLEADLARAVAEAGDAALRLPKRRFWFPSESGLELRPL